MKSMKLPLLVLTLWLGTSLFSALFAMGGVRSAAKAFSSRHALVIGNSSYKFTAPLANPARDARLIAAALENAGFKVYLHTDLSQKQMKRVLRDFSRTIRQLDKNAVSLVYYAGHGTQVAGRNFLVPIDANIDTEADVAIESLAADDVLGQLENLKRGISIIILDACRNNPYKRGRRSSVRGLAPIKAAKGSLVAYSTAPGTVALDGEGTNSPYASALNKYLRTPGLPIEKMFKKVRVEVDRITKGTQTPWEESSLFADFVFLSGKEAGRKALSSNTTVPAKHSSSSQLAAQTAFWNTVKDSKNPVDLESYLQAFPDGLFAPLARTRLATHKKRMKQGLEMIKNKRVSTLLAQQKSKKATHKPRPRSASEDCQLFNRKEGRDLYCVSTVLRSRGAHRKHGAASLLDDTDYTAWIAGKGTKWVVVDFGELRQVNKIILKNGYNKSRDTYYNNGRPTALWVFFSGSKSWETIDIKDNPDTQTLKIPGNRVARWVQVKLWSVKKGQENRTPALNELRVISSPLIR